MSVPFNPEAERDLIGAMLLSDDARRIALDVCVPEDFWTPGPRAAFAAIAGLLAEGQAVDVTTISARCEVPRATLLVWYAGVPASSHAYSFAKIVGDLAASRRALGVASDLTDAASAGDLDRVERLVADAADRISAPSGGVTPAVEASQMAAMDVTHDWKIPRLLEAREVAMVTGFEGFGKSELLAQFAVLCASGLDPWARTGIAPLRVLVVDLENLEGPTTRRYRRLLSVAGDRYRGHCYIQLRPQGLDLTSRRDVRWLDGLCGYHRPDLLVFGPLYKAYRGAMGRSKSSEESAEIVAHVIDELKVKHNMAVMIEAHAGHGMGNDRDGWRPRGSSLWIGWPAFGFGLKPVCNEPREAEFVAWRGAREMGRSWPSRLVSGPPGSWLWEASAERKVAA